MQLPIEAWAEEQTRVEERAESSRVSPSCTGRSGVARPGETWDSLEEELERTGHAPEKAE